MRLPKVFDGGIEIGRSRPARRSACSRTPTCSTKGLTARSGFSDGRSLI
jgi:hypothetical protein